MFAYLRICFDVMSIYEGGKLKFQKLRGKLRISRLVIVHLLSNEAFDELLVGLLYCNLASAGMRE